MQDLKNRRENQYRKIMWFSSVNTSKGENDYQSWLFRLLYMFPSIHSTTLLRLFGQWLKQIYTSFNIFFP